MIKELYFLKEIYCGMSQPEDKVDYPVYLYEHELGEALILDEATDIIVKDKKIVGWTMTTKEQFVKLIVMTFFILHFKIREFTW